MSGIALILDLLRKNPSFHSPEAIHSFGSFSAKAGLSAATAATLASYPFGFRAFLGNSGTPVAHCDAAATWTEDPLAAFRNLPHNLPGYVVEPDSVKYAPKVYHVEPKPLFSAFEWRALTVTTLRSFLMYYLPLLEPRTKLEDDEDEASLPDAEEPTDLITPFKKSVKQIARESTVVTIRRVLERLAVTYVSQRMAWKLLKDAPKSAVRKAQRGMPTHVYFYSVSQTTLRAHCLGVAASWIVQVGLDTYRTIRNIFFSKEEDVEDVDSRKELQTLGRKVGSATVRCSSSLVFASIGAGIGATFIHPSAGQWIGCAVGDFAGPIIVAVCFDKILHHEL